jgi:hypothetical protein
MEGSEMHTIQSTVEEWNTIFISGSIAEKLFTYEQISNHLNEYSRQDIEYIVEQIFPILMETLKRSEAPVEIILIVADIMTKMRPYIHDENVQRGVFIHASKCIKNFLKSQKHARIISELMGAYQPEKGREDVIQN